jgi:hypothetical protein
MIGPGFWDGLREAIDRAGGIQYLKARAEASYRRAVAEEPGFRERVEACCLERGVPLPDWWPSSDTRARPGGGSGLSISGAAGSTPAGPANECERGG